MKGIIYKATNTFNGKVYIGQTIAGLPKRKSQHYKDAKSDSDNIFHVALYQYPNAFEWETIDTFTGSKEYVIHSLNVAEEYHILKCNSTDERYGYNATFGGYSSGHFTDRIRKLASARYGEIRPVLQYTKEGVFVKEFSSASEAARETMCCRKTVLEYCRMKEIIISPNSRTKYVWRFSNGLYAPPKIEIIDLRPARFKKKVRRFNKNGDREFVEVEITEKKLNEYKKKMEHRIIQYSLEGKFVKIWDNTNQAVEAGMDTHAIIRKVLRGVETRKSPNYLWRFFSEDYPQKIEAYEQRTAEKESVATKTIETRPDDTIEELNWTGEVVAVYRNTADAAKNSGCSQSYICNVLAGKIKHPKRRFRRKTS